MDIENELYVEKVPTGALIIITGDYAIVDETEHEVSEEHVFLVSGDLSPETGDLGTDWKLVEPIDFAS
jgi:hypothetical protein